MDGSIDKKANRLIYEKSPYLLQHAYNPVNWLPWGKEAFERAQIENKPVLVSIGYSTCHWCHVMAHESFENQKVAQLLNEKFISIKVDREERPDIDSVYMRICQLMNGHGGWPLNVFLTPDQKPFYAGTYFPRESYGNNPGFIEVIENLSNIFINKRQYVEDIAKDATNSLKINVKREKGKVLGEEVLHRTFQELSNRFDPYYGGFSEEPKFPIPHILMFLLRYYTFTNKQEALDYVTKTLNSMADGGIYDHIGYGFSRYSTDEKWLVPHFEKMLYDNALLLITYTEAYQVTGDERYKRICKQIILFIQEEMTNEYGSFYSALDADTEGEEGKYYAWSKDEIINTLGNELGELYCMVYNITSSGKFESRNIPNLINTHWEKVKKEFRLTEEELYLKLEEARKKLLKKRTERTYPHIDDKILTSWNALMIVGLAKASKVFEEPEYLKMAKTGLLFIEKELIIEERIMVRYRDSEVKNKGFIDDYAFLLWAYIEMYEATFNLTFLKKAKNLCSKMLDLFWDHEEGGFYFIGEDAESLIVQEKEVYDGAMPSGNSVASLQILRLGQMIGDFSLTDKGIRMFSTFEKEVTEYTSGHTFFMQSLLFYAMPKKEIVIFSNEDDKEGKKLIKELQKSFKPNYSILATEKPEDFKGLAEFASQYKINSGNITVYICENYACQQPTTDIQQVIKKLL
ncbi:thioredoxin domain-containing protein [Priestia megaterium]|uniref:thioredoxin domain-containing protein n=1 Tax=Priestia megaterium TaxID=1404 RepID=UPI0039A2C3F6